ncbi:hypothetical protein [Leifsonia xyli]|uniref:hypothetical protein n=1 Tax=Leifsonia xyli TaxID=1575 RepID=UPI0005A05463|nr:hypothetical protein [Leifsonia xyli]
MGCLHEHQTAANPSPRPQQARRSRTAGRRPVDLARQTRLVAERHGWALLGLPPGRKLPDDPPGERSVLVIGDDLAEPAVLRVRAQDAGPLSDDRALGDAGIAFADVRARREARSEHIAGVLGEFPPHRSRGRTVTAVLVQNASRGTLRALLEECPALSAGAAATILVGVARALADLRAAGWAGAAPTSDFVGFRADGCPVLTRLDGVRPTDAAAELADRRAVRALARSIFLAVPRAAAAGLFAAVEGALAHPGWERVSAAVLAAAQPAPVLLSDPSPLAAPANVPVLPDRIRPATRRRETAFPFLRRVLHALDDRPASRVWAFAWTWFRARPRLLAVGAVPLVAAVVLPIALPPAAEPENGADTLRPLGAVMGENRVTAAAPVHASAPVGPGFRDRPRAMSGAIVPASANAPSGDLPIPSVCESQPVCECHSAESGSIAEAGSPWKANRPRSCW